MIYHIVAASENRVIGKDNALPWHFSCDLKHFRELTTGNTVIMGRKTYDSIFDRLGKPLPNRENFVISRSQSFEGDHLKSFTSVNEALSSIETENAFIIGGATIYEQTLDLVDGIHLTKIPGDYEGDAFYPEIPGHFKEKSRKALQEDPLVEAVLYQR